MTNADDIMALAIDGGGTRCRVALSGPRGRELVETGSANVSTDFEGALVQIETGLTQLAQQSAMTYEALAALPAFVGLAGVTGPAIADRLAARLPFATITVEDDRPAALRGALGARDGVLAHCGTGSFYASQIGGRVRLAGGWGSVLGDEASAAWIGRIALGRTLECADGRRPASPLSDHFLSSLDGTAGIVRFAGTARPSDFGALAREVTDHAERGDPLAKGIMQAGADEIARALPLMGWEPGRAICLTGGIGPLFAPYLSDDMQSDLTTPEGQPLDGALALARDLARETGHDGN
ncbi:ATPase [Alphaproteobacteria bacterium GH1-50]|uniref:ATPase n=1 Tax=Kangsaoukella pontilimi TaxID=2691042 RepID=A0A7C9INL4_9RHOB|nr:BadF/BadG/BcrA/BcrD ATPase family protein [Kangsaoukella pontilimi]MXQ07450.1 ATPase [Kangsaoukella pontilimi]